MSSKYFNTLNYTLANEDSALEREILLPNRMHVVSVAGSGSRVLPLFSKRPHKLTVVDVSREQLFLTELRVESAHQFTRDEYLSFWGYPPFSMQSEARKVAFSELHLSSQCREFFADFFKANSYDSLLYCGRWEQTFSKISRACRIALGPAVDQLFEFVDESDFRQYLSADFPEIRWNTLVFMLGNSTLFNALLYRGNLPRKNTPGSHFNFYRSAYDKIFASGLPRQNFFLQLTFLGEIAFAEGNPIECQSGVYEEIQKGIKNAEIEYVHGNVVEFAERMRGQKIDFVSLSDVPSYFDEKTSRDFLQRMSMGLSSEAILVARYYLRELHDIDEGGFIKINSDFEESISSEKTKMYTLDVFKRQSL